MKYTRGQYNAIIRDVESTLNVCEQSKTPTNSAGKPIDFRCNRTTCSFCPFTYDDRKCLDTASFDRDRVFCTARTADEWRQWLEKFQIDNDPDRPYTVEIPARFAEAINTYSQIDSRVPYPVFSLLRRIREQINDQNRN